MLIYLSAALAFAFLSPMITSSKIPYEICRNRGKTKYWWNANCEKIFLWNAERKQFVSLLNVSYSQTEGNKFRKPEGKIVRVLADNMLPYITSSNYSQTLGGFLGDVWSIIQESLGFRSNVTSVFYDTGLELITRGEADIMLAAAVRKEVSPNIYYSQPYFYNWYHLYMKRPQAKISSLLYVKIFERKLWIMSLSMFLILAVALWATMRLLYKKYRREHNISIVSAFLAVISGLINQSFDLKLRSYSVRIQLMFALIFGIILYSAMNAVLVAQLAVSEVQFPFTSLGNVGEKRTHSLCLRTNSFVFNNFTDENRQALPFWRDILNGRDCLDITNQSLLGETVCRQKVVVLENRVVMDSVGTWRGRCKKKVPCNVINFGKRYFKSGNSLIIMKSFQYGRAIESAMKRMRGVGILQRLENKWIRKQKLYVLKSPDKPPVTLDHIKGILFAYAFMIICSVILVGVEIMWKRYESNKEKTSVIYFTN